MTSTSGSPRSTPPAVTSQRPPACRDSTSFSSSSTACTRSIPASGASHCRLHRQEAGAWGAERHHRRHGSTPSRTIVDKGWIILADAESDWRSHAAAVAQSIQLIKKRLRVQSLLDTRCSHVLRTLSRSSVQYYRFFRFGYASQLIVPLKHIGK